MPRRSRSDDDSESEDNPRRILDVNANFTYLNGDPSVTFKLHDRHMIDDGKGNLIPFSGVIAPRPIPSASNVERVRAAMGNGTNGVWVGTVFNPGSGDASPESLFAPRQVNSSVPGRTMPRIVLRRRHVPHLGGLKTMLMFADGSCLGNGTADARAGWAFIFRPDGVGVVSGALEQKGPDDELHVATSNRAELRAAIAALEYRSWWGEGWERIVIATDSEYVVHGTTAWLRSWAARGWRTSGGSPVQNRDLWERLSERMGASADGGCEVSFWRLPRAWNTEADQAAKAAAEAGGSVVEFQTPRGVLV